jgi:hypothetical protein
MRGFNVFETGQDFHVCAILQRLSGLLRELALLALLVVLAALALTRPAVLHMAQPDHEPASEEKPDSGNVIRTDATDLWLPTVLKQLVSDPSKEAILASPSALQRYLGEHRQRTIWYAVTMRHHQANGHVAEITTIKHLNERLRDCGQFLDLLAAIRGEARWYPDADFSRLRIDTIPEDLLNWEPRQAIYEMVSLPRPPGDQN